MTQQNQQSLDVSKSLEVLCKKNEKCSSKLQEFLAKQIWTPNDREALLDQLSVLLVQPDCTLDVAHAFCSLQLDLLHRAERQVFQNGHIQFVKHQKFCVALSKTVALSSESKRFSVKYLQNVPAFFTDQETDQPSAKKPRKSRDKSKPKARDLVQAVHRFLQHLCSDLRELWDWSDFLAFLQSGNAHTRWHAVHSVALLLDMAPARLSAFRRKHFTPQEERDLSIRYDEAVEKASGKALLLSNPAGGAWQVGEKRSHTMKGVVDTDLCEDIVAVCGVLIPKIATPVDLSIREAALLLSVPSTHHNMHCVALAVASCHPVLLEGPVGCGKTALVEHLALLTGRGAAPHLMKVQLGDQTDSKALLGTYRCTDVPGQFEWQPGTLTQAVTDGHWILLEDLDYAPMDVISMLVPLLEGNTLSVPGHGDVIKAAPGFRLFATQRLMRSEFGWYKTRSSGSDILERMWTKICVEPLSRAELQQVIVYKYPQLTTVVDRLLDIYFLLSAGRHDTSDDTTQEVKSDADIGKFLTRDGRLISTRDLMKWCSRIARGFVASAPSTANMVYQEALDCFCASLAHTRHRLPLSEAIAARLNLTKATAEYYCQNYKPTLDLSPSTFTVGRVSLPRQPKLTAGVASRQTATSFAFTRQSVALLEQVAVCVAKNEPVLLVGETGTGKTSSVQFLSQQMGEKLRVINMNQQSDSADLLGGFKPVDLRFVVAPFREEFELLFCETFSRKQNRRFLGHIQVAYLLADLKECFANRRWADLFKLMNHTQKAAVKKFAEENEQLKRWTNVGRRLRKLRLQVKQVESALAFTFVEGTLVRALRQGEWVLLDEINLASAETLECLSGLLESTTGSVVLMERGDTKPIVRHENFRLFACMNPATDVGKKELPLGVRNRFTEFFVDELEDSADLKILVREYLKGLSLSAPQIEGIVKFYLIVKAQAAKSLTDGTGHKPHYSLRTFCRALRQAAMNACESVPRSLYEGFCLAFLTQLDRSSHPIVEKLVCEHIVGKSNIKSLLKQPIPAPPGGKHVKFEGYWVATGDVECVVPDGYVLTPLVRSNLRDLTRVVSAGRYPVLLQGETSVGKTSLITWLARASGNTCVRINNHEHTDLQEYIGCYAADDTGKLAFQEGVLVEAMRKGHWIILDELNLAPSDVLEALNRLLDDNRELFIPETQETVKAHSRFMLFATQNPPGQYAGRKILSRAFRNRFVELHFDEIPSSELETILHKRCSLPMSHCRRLVKIMLELQVRRRSSGVFAGKQGYITLRDLFRWAERYHLASQECTAKFFDWDQLLADNGYMLLAGRVRKPEECHVICEVIEKHLKRRVDPNRLFTLSDTTSPTTAPILNDVTITPPGGFEHVVWTYSLRRMAVLVGQALKFGEPVLLVGDTGCGKTTMCQLFAAVKKQRLYSVNCHLHTESADFLGGLRPVRHHDESSNDNLKLFEWCDGPLVSAMKEGTMFLVDEISLADDSVLERLNSVLEPERTLVLAEKGGGDGARNEVEQIFANDAFRIVATMNPGGDYGKKELSPALRNRFTEIWCPQSMDRTDLIAIIEHNLSPGVYLSNQEDGTSGIGRACMDFVHWFVNNNLGRRATVSIRDLLSWVNFVNVTSKTVDSDGDDKMEADTTGPSRLEPAVAYVHGACMTFLDALGSGVMGNSGMSSAATKSACLRFLLKQVVNLTGQQWDVHSLGLPTSHNECAVSKQPVVVTSDSLVIWPFSVPRGPRTDVTDDNYALDAPTTYANAQRVLRALQLPRPILLEGSPGVGKTSLVSAIARAASHHLVRINLSEQTDVTDLFGADLPVEGGQGGQFAWRDGPLLRALKAGHWIVLDELNLASQSVLEGLNACLDHRAEVYVPELGKTFHVEHGKTRLFACQNPLSQGGGRKGLPKSFLNRFTQVYVEQLSRADLLYITGALYPQLPGVMLAKMVDFNSKVYHQTMIEGHWGRKGSPWEFNLRDICRWCDLLVQNQTEEYYDPGEYVSLVYADRMRTATDKQKVFTAFEETFDSWPSEHCVDIRITTDHVQIGHSWLKRRGTMANLDASGRDGSLQLLHHCVAPLESLIKCIQMNWMAILVGPACSGKTSLVRLLAQLSGHPLHILPVNSAMDTTELLGGFEQSDLNRHLEELSNQVKETLSDICSQLLLTNQSDALSQVRAIMGVWTTYGTIGGDGDSRDDVEETRQRIKTLDRLVSLLLTATATTGHSQDQLATFSHQLAKLTNQLQRDKSTNHGGRFEWVDSLLVHALQAGHWLLIDNANFCSPSVLDRLNALMEPGGVLSINERGVIDGQIPTISPHADFRLILAMDPKRGEISRAMRNRGVEIFIPGEGNNNYDEQDVKQMLGEIGLSGDIACDIAISLHRRLQGAVMMPTAEQFGLLQLLQTGRLVAERLERGVSLDGALIQGFTDVYVRGQSDVSLKQKLTAIIAECIEGRDLRTHEVDPGTSCLLECVLSPNSLPTAGDWCQDVAMATVRQNSALLMHLINQMLMDTEKGPAEPPTLSKASGEMLDKASDLSSLLPFAARVCLESTASDDHHWHLTSSWLTQQLQKLLPKGCGSGHDAVHLSKLSEVITCTMAAVFSHPLMGKIQEGNKILSGTAGDLLAQLRHQPWDVRWNSALLNHYQVALRKARTQLSRTNIEDEFQRLFALVNQLYVVGHLAQTRCLHSATDEQGILGSSTRHRVAPLLQLSKACHEGVLDLDQLPDKVIAHLYPFVSLLDEELQNFFQSDRHLTDEQTDTMWQHLHWYERFVCVCQQPIRMKQFVDFLPRLSLHWNWLQSKMFAPVFASHSLSPDLHAVATKLHVSLGIDCQATKLYQALWRDYGHPRTCASANMAALVQQILDLSAQIDTHKLSAVLGIRTSSPLPLMQLVLHCGTDLRTSMLEALCRLRENKDDAHVEDIISSTEEVLERYGLQQSAPPGDTETNVVASENVDATKVMLWPVYDLVAIQTEFQLLAEFLMHDGTENRFRERVQKFLDFHLTNCPFSSPAHLLPWKQLLVATDIKLTLAENHSEMLLQFLDRLHSSPATNDTDRWLLWQPGSITMDEGRAVAGSLPQGPATLHLPVLSHTAFSLMTNEHSLGDDQKKAPAEEANWLPSNVQLRECREKVEQIRMLNQLMWLHSNESTTDASVNSVNALVGAFARLMSATVITMPETHQPDAREVFESLPAMMTSQQGDMDVNFHTALSHTNLAALFPDFGPIATRCLASIKECSMLLETRETLLQQCMLGEAWTYTGLLQAFLLAPQGPVDPAEKLAVKLDYFRQELKDIENELRVRHWHREILTGQTPHTASLHPREKYLARRQQQLQDLIDIYSGQMAYRPDPSQFPQLLQEVKQFLSSIGSAKRVMSLLDNLKGGFHGNSATGSMLHEVHSWLDSARHFLNKMQMKYLLYRDLLVPFWAGLAQMQYGLSLMVGAVDIQQKRMSLTLGGSTDTQDLQLEDVITDMCRFPAILSDRPNSLALAKRLLKDSHLQTLRHLLVKMAQDSGDGDRMDLTLPAKYMSKCLKCALLHVKNHAMTTRHLDTDTVYMMSRLFHLYVTAWERAERERAEREVQRESLYRYKTQAHGDGLSEEDREELEIRESFPTFEQDFEDIIVGFTLDDKPKRKSAAPEASQSEDGDENEAPLMKISQQEMIDVCEVHRQLFAGLTSTLWHQGALQTSDDMDYVQPLITGYQVAALIEKQVTGALLPDLDGRLLGGHLLVSRLLQNVASSDNEAVNLMKPSRPYDVYHDPNVPEVVQCRPLLERFITRVDNLLQEWPDHPTLKQLIVVTTRVLSFAVTSPVMKFVTGLEVLLQKAQEWESNAAKHVSLREHLDAVTQMVIQWRKLELRYWNNCLDTVASQAHQRAARWWFHIYQLVQSYLQPPPNASEQAEVDGQKKQTPVEVIKALQQFIEGSTLGEFDARLELLQAFHCQVTHMDQSEEQESLVKILWSVHAYYSQFMPVVQQQIFKLRSPIEKLLKGFVKVARWNDINFYALKQTVEKTHRTLHKHMKQFENILRQPVRATLTDNSSDWSEIVQGKASTQSDREIDQRMFVSSCEKVEENLVVMSELTELQKRLPSLTVKAKKHSLQVMSSLPYPGAVAGLGEFTEEIIETVHDLQSLDASQIGDEKKRKSEVKHIQLRKRKALADLFRQLSAMGLSYRKGLVTLRKDSNAEVMCTLPLDVTVALSRSPSRRCDEETAAAWEGCLKYHVRCVARRALFHTALQTPSQELGTANIDRCKGFAEHIMSVVVKQWQTLAQHTQDLATLRRITGSIQHIKSGENCSLPPQDITAQWLGRLKTLCDGTLECLRQYRLLLQCCPTQPPGVATCVSPQPLSRLAPVCQMTQESEDWTDTVTKVQEMITSLDAIKKEVDREVTSPQQLYSWSVMDMVKLAFERFGDLANTLQALVAGFIQHGRHNSLAESLTFITDWIKKEVTEFTRDTPVVASQETSSAATSCEDFMTSVDLMLTDVLLAIQNLVNRVKEQRSTEGEGCSEECQEEDGEEEDDATISHLVELQNNLEHDYTALRLNKVLHTLLSIEQTLTTWSSDHSGQAVDAACQLLSRCLPLLQQYGCLVQYHLTVAIATHRASSKLLSVLLRIFSELAQKGFCLPADMTDEMEGEGATQFEDIEGGGMGEGEGAKDVSDQIETEDQLDEARKAGEEKQEQDPNNQPDIAPEENAIEMSDDIDGKLHDLEPTGGSDEDSEPEMDEKDLDKQMGELDGNDAEKLDEQIWGSDEEEEEEQKDTKEEFGPGDGAQSEAEMVAKDDNQDGDKEDKGKEGKKRKEEGEDGEDQGEEQQPHALEEEVDDEYDENERDDDYNKDKKTEEPPPMDLPEDLNLDGEQEGKEEGDKAEEGGDENPLEIDNMIDQEEGKEEGKDGRDKEEEQGSNAEEKEMETEQDGTGEEEEKQEAGEGEEMEVGQGEGEEEAPKDEEEESAKEQPGLEPQDVAMEEDENDGRESDKKSEDLAQAAEHAGKTKHDSENVQESELARDAGAKNEEQEKEGGGLAEAEKEEGHEGDNSTSVTTSRSQRHQQTSQRQRQRPGQSMEDRSLGSVDEKVERRLKTVDSKSSDQQEEQEGESDKRSELYEHVKDSQSHYDTQTMDAATANQQQTQPVPMMQEDEEADAVGDDDTEMRPDDSEPVDDENEVDKLQAAKLKSKTQKEVKDGEKGADGDGTNNEETMEISGEKVETSTVSRGEESSYHTAMDHYNLQPGELDVDKLRAELEQQLQMWSHPAATPDASWEEEEKAVAAWHDYEALTQGLAQELCEQLRLVLEPSQATKLKGDYRTGKRLNMRKVIPYIASQFRKDKIWLRRTKPSKRQYQVMVAVDDSSSMADNHSRQLAFESLAVIANALTLLEVGEVAICSFGESTGLLHSFQEQFSSQSGAKILQQFSFEQKKTKIAQLLKHITGIMLEARSHQRGGGSTSGDISQLLLIVSDGRGLFLEGMEAVKSSVRQAMEANVFVVFVVIDNPDNKDSILDIRVPVFKGPGELPEIKSYMDIFPFPFYVILRDTGSLPHTLSDALRQWFELVTATDK